jgi:cytochrome c biogenesis protein CcmG/thiol:disulfide interchange protein DsbE
MAVKSQSKEKLTKVSLHRKLIYFIPAFGFLAFLIISATALYGTMTGTRQHTPQTSPLLGKDAPVLPELALNADKEVLLSALRGKPVLVNFMASWCLPCRAEIPALDLLHDDVAIIAVAYKDKPEDTAAFLAEYGDPFDGVWMDSDGRAGLNWGIYGVPETFVIDAEGKVVLRHAGPIFKDVLNDVIIPQLEQLK